MSVASEPSKTIRRVPRYGSRGLTTLHIKLAVHSKIRNLCHRQMRRDPKRKRTEVDVYRLDELAISVSTQPTPSGGQPPEDPMIGPGRGCGRRPRLCADQIRVPRHSRILETLQTSNELSNQNGISTVHARKKLKPIAISYLTRSLHGDIRGFGERDDRVKEQMVMTSHDRRGRHSPYISRLHLVSSPV